jgi:curli biogenesis system outer membrane secretion channel CsgG
MRKSLILSAAALMLVAAPAFATPEVKSPSAAPVAPAATQVVAPVATPVAGSDLKKEGEIKTDAMTISTDKKPELTNEIDKGKTEVPAAVTPAKH